MMSYLAYVFASVLFLSEEWMRKLPPARLIMQHVSNVEVKAFSVYLVVILAQ